MRGYVINANIAACADAAKLLDHDVVISHFSSLTKARASSAANAGKQVCERGLWKELERTYLLTYLPIQARTSCMRSRRFLQR